MVTSSNYHLGQNAINLTNAAYDDYLASRFLLNNGFALQGATLASTAIEKYLKALLTCQGVSFSRVHLDNLVKLEAAFAATPFHAILTFFDQNFLTVITTVYSFRYLDNIKSPTSVGFFLN